MGEERLGRRHRGQWLFWQTERPMQKAAGSARVDEQVPREFDGLIFSGALQAHARDIGIHLVYLNFIEVFHAKSLRLLHEIMIKAWTVPVSIGDFLAGTCPNQ